MWQTQLLTEQEKEKEAKLNKEKKYDEDVAKWLQSRPEVGSLNSGKFYIHAGPDRVYTEIEVFS
mgnify:FL=1